MITAIRHGTEVHITISDYSRVATIRSLQTMTGANQ